MSTQQRLKRRIGGRGGGSAAHYLGRPAGRWMAAMSRPSSRDRVRCDGQDGALPVAIVTGGGRGLGRLVAQALANNGFAVGLVARSADQLERSRHLIEASGGVAAAIPADVGDDRALRTAIARLRRRLGPVDLLVNNAGVPGPAGPSWEVDPSSWWDTLGVNLGGTFAGVRSVLPDMVARRRGRIVNITSHAGVFRWPGVSAYSVSKAAVVKLTENLAFETRRHGISVFGVNPGILPIGFSEAALAHDTPYGSCLGRVHAWIRRELDEGRGTDPATAVDLVVRLSSGRYDALSGRQVSVHDDLDEVLERIDDVRHRELYVLGLQRLSA
jgi:NAD(P)-dependent dehydrogenase (short-subunit alcohol dehydrogenase family)